MRILAALLSLSVALLVAQTSSGARKRSRGRADAGQSDDGGPLFLGPDRPGSLKPEPPAAHDGGVRALADAGFNSDGGTLAQLQELRARIAALEQQVANSQQQAQQLETMNEQIQALRDQLASMDAARQQEQQQTQAQKNAVQAGIESLGAAEQQLAVGNTSIGTLLDQAQASFTGQAQRDVQAARYALQSGDVAGARVYLSKAVTDAQQGH
jgi:TolA-binding protein